ncbi:3-deoxy-D-arabino-heptulosonate 7-phosphate synthase [Achromobacter xylosoxidans]
MPTTAPLHAILHAVARRYRVSGATAGPATHDHAGALARIIERLQAVVSAGGEPGSSWRDAFLTALDGLVRDALRPDGGDPAFQAAVLAYRQPEVRAYLALRREAAADSRKMRTTADALAHPRKPARLAPGPARELLAQLHAATTTGAWREVAEAARALSSMPQVTTLDDLASALRTLRDDPALARLCRGEALAAAPAVQRYESLRARLGPRAGSNEASAQALLARQRGVAVEAMAARALEAVARYLDQAEGPQASAAEPRYRVVTSLRVPAGLAADADRAKTEWDGVLLRRADPAPLWDVCVMVEAKASVEAATTDLPRLLRGLRLLARAQPGQAYAFSTQQGMIQVRGASLAALPVTEATLAQQVLYCSDAPVDAAPAGLHAASRMQLLSAPSCLAYAAALSEGRAMDKNDLAPLWQALRHDPRWRPVLDLAAMRQLARSVMVHPDDLLATVARLSTPAGASA